MYDKLLSLFVAAQTEIASAASRSADEDGAPTVEYIMILGILAIIVAALFFSNGIGLKDAILGLGETVKEKLTDAKTL